MKNNLNSLQQRIRAVESTKKVTNVMKMIASSRFKTLHDMLIATQSFEESIFKMIDRYFVSKSFELSSASPLISFGKKQNKILLICISSDKSLCGSFNASIANYVDDFLNKNKNKEIEIMTIGSKITKFLTKHWPNKKLYPCSTTGLKELRYSNILDIIAEKVLEMFLSGEFESVQMIFFQFINSLKNNIVCKYLLPIRPSVNFLDNEIEEYEPSVKEVSERLFDMAFKSRLYAGIIHNNTVEQCVRMLSMDGANRNAKKIADSLILARNMARQSGITNELMEIIGGAEASKR